MESILENWLLRIFGRLSSAIFVSQICKQKKLIHENKILCTENILEN
jgi:hypothetical protein